MEISNNLIPTLSTADSPSQPSEENPQVAKGAKKKVPGEESSFDGALAAIAQPQPKVPPAELGKLAADLKGLKDQEAGDKVELSTKGKATAAKAEEGGAPAPTLASLFQAKAEESAKGPMANAFVTGPDQPWGSRWVFAGGNQPAPEEIEAIRTSGGKPAPLQGAPNLEQLKKLVEAVQAQGGDETQLKQAAESTLEGIDSAIAALGGELESVRPNPPEKAAAAPTVLGGTEFLSALQGAKAPVAPRGSASMTAPKAEVSEGSVLAKKAVQKPALQVIPGGLAMGEGRTDGRLESGARLSKDEPKLQTDTFYPNGMPPSAAVRAGAGLGAGVTPTVVTGHVVPGAMMRDRLTSESLQNVASGITGMSGAGGGEMRIRLNPGNLGELMIRVSTSGKDVGLKVQANDPAAKKVIEESLGALRDSLAQQNLSLGRVDVTLAPVSTANSSDPSGQNPQSQSNGNSAFAGFDAQSQANQGRFMDGSSSREDRSSRFSDSDSERSVSRSASARIAAMGTGSTGVRGVDTSRLDVMA